MMTGSRITWIAIPVTLGGLLLAGCSQQSAHHDGAASPAAAPSMAMPSMAMPSAAGAAMADPADVMFAQMMIPHHEQAVVIAELAQTRAANPEVKVLAEEIMAAQAPEIEQMSGWLQAWGAPRLTADEAMDAHGGHGMAGMLAPEVLDELRGLSGPAFDQRFAAAMIEHHRGAIEMAQGVVNATNPQVAELATAIIQTQQAEIDRLAPIAEG